MNAEGCEPAGAGHAFDGWRPPPTRPDKRSAWGKIHDLSCPHAQHGVYASLHEEREMRIGAQAPIPPQDIPRPSARMDRLHLGQVVGEEGRDHQLQEQARCPHARAPAGAPRASHTPAALRSAGRRRPGGQV